MKDPIRLRESASGASEPMRELLAGARATRRMTDVERARIIVQGAKIAALPAGGLLSSPALIGAAKVVAGVVFVIAGAKALPSSNEPATIAARRAFDPAVEMVTPAITSSRPMPEVSVAMPADVMPVPTSILSAPVRVPISKRIVRPEKPIAAAISSVDPAPAEGAEWTREARQLAEAGALVATNPTQAIEQLDAHRTAFPRGKLGIEREVLVIDALVRAGRKHEARARGEALLSKSNGSLYEPRIRRMLEN